MHLAGLTQLTSLNLWRNQIGPKGARYLAGLTQLTSLNLNFNQIGPEGPRQLAGLTQLTYLDLVSNQIGAEGTEHLARLTQLTSLNLNINQIGDEGTRHLAGLTKLTTLDLESNQIGPDGAHRLAGLTQLTYLNLCSNQLKDEGFFTLHRDFRGGNLQRLYLNDNNITVVDAAVLETGNAQVIFDTYLDGRTLPHARVMFVGMGAVGKSALAKRCFRGECVGENDPHDSTHDVELIRPGDCKWKPVINTADGEKKVETPVWDFAGQLVTHGVHEAFLENDRRTVYVLTLAADRVPEKPPGSVNEREWNRLTYWLQTLHHFTDPAAPVIVAITRCDKPPRCADRPIDVPLAGDHSWQGLRIAEVEPDLVSTVHGVSVTAIVDNCSAHERAMPIEPLQAAIQSAIGQLSAVKEGKVQPELPRLKELVEDRIRGRTVVPWSEFATWCVEIGVTDESRQRGLLTTLHYFGTVTYFGVRQRDHEDEAFSGPHTSRRSRAPESLQDQVLNPRWFKWCVYEIIRTSQDTSIRPHDGWFRIADIEQVVHRAHQEFTLREASPQPSLHKVNAGIIREALEHVGLCWHDQTGERYLFPSGLPEFTPLHSEDWSKSHLQWNFLPEANFLRLIVELHRSGYVVQQEGRYQHGRNCVVIESPRHPGTLAAVVGFPDEGRIEIRYDPAGDPKQWPFLLDTVRHEIEDRIQGVKVVNEPAVPVGIGQATKDIETVDSQTVHRKKTAKLGRTRLIPTKVRIDREKTLQDYLRHKAGSTMTHVAYAEKHRPDAELEEIVEEIKTAQDYRKWIASKWREFVKQSQSEPTIQQFQKKQLELHGWSERDLETIIRAAEVNLSRRNKSPEADD
ncbi:MAG: COR domain-containing protein [Planctomycetaceae bacterium]|nr:COR domain-containing protein [Planctomycetaceae bacterium]